MLISYEIETSNGSVFYLERIRISEHGSSFRSYMENCSRPSLAMSHICPHTSPMKLLEVKHGASRARSQLEADAQVILCREEKASRKQLYTNRLTEEQGRGEPAALRFSASSAAPESTKQKCLYARYGILSMERKLGNSRTNNMRRCR